MSRFPRASLRCAGGRQAGRSCWRQQQQGAGRAAVWVVVATGAMWLPLTAMQLCQRAEMAAVRCLGVMGPPLLQTCWMVLLGVLRVLVAAAAACNTYTTAQEVVLQQELKQQQLI